MIRAVPVLGCALVSACGGIVSHRTSDLSDDASGNAADSAANLEIGSADAAPAVDAAPDDVTREAAVMDAGPTVSMATACAFEGRSRPDAFVDSMFEREVPPGCGGGWECTIQIQLAGCDAKVGPPHPDAVVERILPPADCLVLQSWLTSDFYLNALRDPTLCDGVSTTTNPELHSVDLAAGEYAGGKVPNECIADPFRRNRQCLQAFLDAYFPGQKL
jgi:hypothetical protein